jgi:dihydroneopterin aldolase
MVRLPDDGGDRIHIRELKLTAHIGVPEEERAKPQRLTVSLTLWPTTDFRELEDRLEKTVDYATICEDVKEFVRGRNDKLIETMGDAIARHVLEAFPLRRVDLELRKFILPDVDYVAVLLTRER